MSSRRGPRINREPCTRHPRPQPGTAASLAALGLGRELPGLRLRQKLRCHGSWNCRLTVNRIDPVGRRGLCEALLWQATSLSQARLLKRLGGASCSLQAPWSSQDTPMETPPAGPGLSDVLLIQARPRHGSGWPSARPCISWTGGGQGQELPLHLLGSILAQARRAPWELQATLLPPGVTLTWPRLYLKFLSATIVLTKGV